MSRRVFDSEEESIANYVPRGNEVDRSLLCTEPGCGAKWSVKFDTPKCSFHAWGPRGNKFASMENRATTSATVDKKAWAKRIVAAHKDGEKVRPLSLETARKALREKVSEE